MTNDVEKNAQAIVTNLESEILDDIHQYENSGGVLREMITTGLKKRYDIYADFINTYDELLLPNYIKISKFMKDEFKINNVNSDIIEISDSISSIVNGVITSDQYIYDLRSTKLYGQEVFIAETVKGKLGFVRYPEEYINAKFCLDDELPEPPKDKDLFIHVETYLRNNKGDEKRQ